MKTIAVCNEKGGVGKTTTAVAMAAILRKVYKKKVLVIDSDVQCNTSKTYRCNLEDGIATLYDIVVSDEPTPIGEIIQHTELGDIIPSDPLLSEFNSMDNRKMLALKKELKAIDKEYDFCIIDTPPTSWEILKAVLVATDFCVVPTRAAQYGLEGLEAIWNMIRAVRDGVNPDLHITGILVTEYERRLASLENIRIIKEVLAPYMDTEMFSTPIRKTVAVEEAQIRRTSLLGYAPQATAERDYERVCKEMLEREGLL